VTGLFSDGSLCEWVLVLMGLYVIGSFCVGLLCDGSFCDESYSDDYVGAPCRLAGLYDFFAERG
jgi:hypothetical protein